MELLYCIDCDEYVLVTGGINFGHKTLVETEFGKEIDFCGFPSGWATCPPPEVPTIDQYVDSTVSE